MARDAVFSSWNNDRANAIAASTRSPMTLGTAVNVQAMVFGNLGDTRGTGVGLHAQSRQRRQGVLRRIPDERAGEDVVAGIRTPIHI